MLDFLNNLFDTSDFPPRWNCGNWTSFHGWLHIVSDLGVWSAYVAIPIVLGTFVLRRRDLPFQRVFWLFGAFILACGSTHLMEVIIFWWPVYRLAAIVKLFTAIVSWATVIALIPIIPQALALRTPRDLEKEILDRQRAEEALRAAHADLEERVRRRTADLVTLNAALKIEVAERKRAQEDRERLLASERAARSEAERVSRMKDEFLATLSHELRTPLNAILGWSQLLRRNQLGTEDTVRGLETIERNCQVQVQLVEDLLDMSRIISGKIRLSVEPVDLRSIVEGALESVRPAADAKGIRLEVSQDPVGNVMGDAARLQQVLWNLVNNAIKFTPKGGSIQVLLHRVDSNLETVVHDTGQGIKPDFLPYVFDRFRQADGSTTRKFGGMGLGLSIVKQLVELHGGTVCATSPGEGQGASFTVSLPVASDFQNRRPDAADCKPVTTTTDYEAPDLQGIKILVVDDEPDARDLVKRILLESSASIFTASSAAEALELFEIEKPHLLVSDIGMPEEDGYFLIRQIRAMGPERGGKIPAIALTAFARSEDRRRALVAGFQAHVPKPIEAAELLAVIASLAENSLTAQR